MDRRARNRLVVALIVILGVTGVAAILASRGSAPAELTVTGVVAGIDSEGIDRVRSFNLRTNEGQILQFVFGIQQNAAEFPPGHLAEHQATGQPVKVFYVQQGESMVAVRIDDAS